MQHKTIPFKLILLGVLVSSLLAQTTDQVGYLSVDVPDSFHVFLNDQLLNRGSFDNLALQAGNYNIHAYNMQDRSWVSRGMSQKILIQAEKTENVSFLSPQKIKIISNPPAGKVYYNKQYLGFTPLQFFSQGNELFSAEITVLKSGYQEQKFTLRPEMDEYFINLKPEADFHRNIINRARPETDGFRWTREGLVITSLATSWLSFFLKREADKNYDKYLRSSDPDRMDYYYDKTQTLDTYAEISVGISVVSLGTYFYFLLSE